MKQINYKSDFDFILRLHDCRGDEIGWPDYDWAARLYVPQKATSYAVSCIGGKCTNCYNDNGLIHVTVNNHGLMPGVINITFSAILPNSDYPDGDECVVVPAALEIELIRAAAPCPDGFEVEMMLPYMKMRWEDLTPRQIAELKQPAVDAAAEAGVAVKGMLSATAEAVRAADAATKAAIEAAADAEAAAGNAREMAEAARVAAQIAGETNETVTGAEAVREANEKARVEAEQVRGTNERGRVEAETKRRADESERGRAETARAESETGREEAERMRVAGEKARIEAETGRKDAEVMRVSEETARKDAETKRAAAEVARAEAEKLREAAESKRAEEFEGFQDTLDGKQDQEPGKGLSANDFTDELKADVEAWKEWKGTQFAQRGFLMQVTSGGFNGVANPQYANSGYIAINKDCDVDVNVAAVSSVYALAFFDAARDFISGVASPGGTAVHSIHCAAEDIPENAAFFVVSTSNADRISEFSYTNGPTLEAREKAITDAITESVREGREWRGAQFSVVGLLQPNGGLLSTAAGAWRSTPFIPYSPQIIGELSLWTNYAGDKSGGVYFYDSNRNFISHICTPSREVVLFSDLEIPSNTAFIRLSVTGGAEAGKNSYYRINNLESLNGATSEAIAASKMALFIDQWNAACKGFGKYNPATGFFELNGLTDITYKEALGIYRFNTWQLRRETAAPNPSWYISGVNLRTVIPVEARFVGDYLTSFNNTEIQVWAFGCMSAISSGQIFKGGYFPNVTKVIDVIQLSDPGGTNIFIKSPKLTDFSIIMLNVPLNLAVCPKISLESVQFMIANSACTVPTMVTVHPDIYAKLTGDTANDAAGALSEEELAEWAAVMTAAVSKNIAFATV